MNFVFEILIHVGILIYRAVHAGPQLGEVARLDTCVTVIDAAEFYNNLGSMKHYEEKDEKGFYFSEAFKLH